MLVKGDTYKVKVGNDKPRKTENGVYIGESINRIGLIQYVFALPENSTYGVYYSSLALDMGDSILDAINVYYNERPLKSVKFYIRQKEDIVGVNSIKDMHIFKLNTFYA